MFFVQKDMVNCKAHTVSNGNDGAFATTTSSNFTVLCVKITIFTANSGVSTFN